MSLPLFRMFMFAVLLCLSILHMSYTVTDRPFSFRVRQIPDKVTKAKGENVSLYCAFQIFGQKALVDVYWKKEGQEETLAPTPHRRMTMSNVPKGFAELHLLDVGFRDSGIYYCSVRDEKGDSSEGNGTRIIVHVSPTPLKIKQMNIPSLALNCTTAPFFPKDCELTWYKDGHEITSGISTSKIRNDEGLYLVSSFLQVVDSRSVYSCNVSHVTLPFPTVETHRILEMGTSVKLFCFLAGGFAICVLIIPALAFFARRCKLHSTEAPEDIEVRTHHFEKQSPTYADLNFSGQKKTEKNRRHEEQTTYAAVKQSRSVLQGKFVYVAHLGESATYDL